MDIHAKRIGSEKYNFAFWDIFLTLAGVIFISSRFNYNFFLVLIITIFFFIAIHKVSGTKTALNNILFDEKFD